MVKGTNFINLRDAGDPVELAAFTTGRADELVFPGYHGLFRRAQDHPGYGLPHRRRGFYPLYRGGGISTLEDIRAMLSAGADKVSINTAAVKNPGLVAEASERFGSQCIVVAIDARQCGPASWEIYIHGGALLPDWMP